MEVVCIGSGYVGSVTGTAFAVLGHSTTVIDLDPHKILEINSGRSPIYEPWLSEFIAQMVSLRRLSATSSYDCVRQADVVFIAVGTPSQSDGTVDLKYIKAAARSIGEHINPHKFTVIINKSTVPVGTADLVAAIIEEASGLHHELHFAVVSNPEFLREGFALEDVFFPDRVVIGTANIAARVVMRQLYETLIDRVGYDHLPELFVAGHPLAAAKADYFETDTKSAEMIKYAANAFLAVKISYINEVARLCETLGANVLDVATGMGLDSRIGGKFLQVSSGWSGSCFPKDTAELLTTSRKYGSELTLVKAAVQSNVQMHDFCIRKIQRQLTSLNGKHIAVLGLTFKPNTDDARNTQASYIIAKLQDLGATIAVHDPQGMSMFKVLNNHLPIHYCEKAEDTAVRADALVLLTHWDEYRGLNWQHIYETMKHPYLLDTRNYFTDHPLRQLGFIYEGLGV